MSTGTSTYIIDGGIGAGKTTFMRRLAASPHIVHELLGDDVVLVPVYEPLESWQRGGIFKLMCAAPGEWGAEFQHVAMVTRIAVWAQAVADAPTDRRVVLLLERAPAADRLVFTEVHRQRGSITEPDAAEHAAWHRRLWEKRPADPVRVAILRCPLEMELDRMGVRDRDGEDKYRADYLEDVFNQYARLEKHPEWPHPGETVVVDSSANYRDCDRLLYRTAAQVFGCTAAPEREPACGCKECTGAAASD